MKLGTGKRMNKQISEISPKMTLPMFMIGLIIFVVVAINVNTAMVFGIIS